MLKLSHKDTKAVVRASLDLDLPVMLWGPSGAGKSDLVKQLGEERGATVIDIRLSQYDSVDLRGLPVVKEGLTMWNSAATLPFVGNPAFAGHQEIILFLDEIVHARQAVQAVAFQLVLDGAVGEHKLLPNVKRVAAGNRASDKPGGERMLAPLANRFLHVEVAPDLDGWCKWAYEHDIDPNIIAFLRLRPDLLMTFDPAKLQIVFATLRSWMRCSQVLTANLPENIRYAMFAGLVDDGPAAELEGFLRMLELMPDPENILKSPETAPVPTEPAVLYAVSSALAYRASKKTLAAIIKYIARLPVEYNTRTMKDIIGRDPSLQFTKEFSLYSAKYSGLYD